MSDIAKRLRWMPNDERLAHEAADEIERVRRENTVLKEHNERWLAEIERLRAEVAHVVDGYNRMKARAEKAEAALKTVRATVLKEAAAFLRMSCETETGAVISDYEVVAKDIEALAQKEPE